MPSACEYPDLNIAEDAVLRNSTAVPEGSLEVNGCDFSKGTNYDHLIDSYRTTGLHVNSMGNAVRVNAVVVPLRYSVNLSMTLCSTAIIKLRKLR
ncbi:unnamed protein product [Anisakis simplex]|uniref:ZP domain-containing protein n=1 Tax=Anisakis simplex TaxID=6269 RepID=A0A0M3JUB7_ANISI|nr:unnamed protein product [Anisakis simplex]